MSKLATAALAFAVGAALALPSFWMSAGDKQQAQAVERKTTAQRAEAGPRVVSSKALSTTEDLSLIVIPSELGAPMDVRCFVYKNREFQQVVFTCPNANQTDMSLIDDFEPQR